MRLYWLLYLFSKPGAAGVGDCSTGATPIVLYINLVLLRIFSM